MTFAQMLIMRHCTKKHIYMCAN